MSEDSAEAGGAAARAAIEAAEVVGRPQDGKPAGRATGKAAGGRRRRAAGGGLNGCPVTPLGTWCGTFYYLDAVGQLRELKARDHGNKDLLALFAPKTRYLHDTWPRMNDKGMTTGWRPEQAGEELMNACARAGVWNASDRVRGRGAWLDLAGGLILHCGDQILIEGDWREPGLHGEHVYPSGAALPRPGAGRAGAALVDELLEMLQTWQWQRPTIDPLLMLGWLGAAKLGGALEWRPAAWVTGDKGTGKSTLHHLIHGVLGGALLRASDASEAGVRQTLGNQTLPVALDELEAEEDNRKLQALVKLARQASSGGTIVRGGADHQAQDFVARSCFLMSSILIPPLMGQDRSRIAVLSLDPLPAGAARPALSAGLLRDIGAAMQRRLVDGWPRWPQTLDVYRRLLERGGHTARGADQFGVLLAAADLLLSDTQPTEAQAAETVALMGAAAMNETTGESSDAERCLMHLLTSSVVLESGRPQTVAHWINRAADEQDEEQDGLGPRPSGGDKGLAVIGLRVLRRRDGSRWLAVSVAHQGLGRLFAGSHWQGKSGADGVWSQSLARLEGAARNQNVRVNGVGQKCVCLPLALVRDEGAEAL